ncbi:MAG: sialidase family protein [Pyrinomonadaceae bacterium]
MAGCARQPNQETSKDTAAAAKPSASMGQPVRISAEDRDAAEPAMATGQDGSVYLAWVEHRDGGADVMFARLNGEGQRQGTPVRVNPKAGEATAWRGDPPTVAAGPDGTIYVGWTARVVAAEGHANDLYLSASRDHGQTFDPPVKVHDDRRPATHGMHSLAVSRDGRIYLAWLDERNINLPQPSDKAGGHHMESNREVFTTASSDGGRSFAPNVRVASDACPCCKTALAVGPEGNLYVSWRQVLPGDFRHIAVSSSSDQGKTFSPAVIVSDDRWMLKGCPVSGSALAAGSDGALHVLWYAAGETGEPGIYWSESRDGGRTFTPRHLFANMQSQGTPVLLRGSASGVTGVWEAVDNGSSRVILARQQAGAGNAAARVNVSDGALPSAAASGDNLYIAYIGRGSSQERSIWLVSAKFIS